MVARGGAQRNPWNAFMRPYRGLMKSRREGFQGLRLRFTPGYHRSPHPGLRRHCRGRSRTIKNHSTRPYRPR